MRQKKRAVCNLRCQYQKEGCSNEIKFGEIYYSVLVPKKNAFDIPITNILPVQEKIACPNCYKKLRQFNTKLKIQLDTAQ
jgi:hypothetical protein